MAANTLPASQIDDDEGNIDPTGGNGAPPARRNAPEGHTEVEIDDEDTEDDDSESDEDTDWTPPSREEWQRTQEALSKANGEAKKYRLRNRDLTRGAKKADEDGAADGEAEKAAEARYKPVAIRSAAKAALLEAGLNDASDGRVKKMLKLIDIDEVDVDDDGDVVGLDDQIAALKEDYPELFKAPEPQTRKRAPRLDAAGRSGGASAPKTTGDLIAARVLGRKV